MILDCESEFSRIRSFPIEYVLEIPVHETDSDRYADSESGPVLYVGSSAQVVLPYSCIPVDVLELPVILDCESKFSKIRSFPIEYVLENPCMRASLILTRISIDSFMTRSTPS